VAAHPDRFIGVAQAPTVSSALKVAEAQRAVLELGLAGIALFCGPTVKPLDHPDFEALYAVCESMGAPIWMHPCRPQNYADYDQYQAEGKGSQHQIWNSLGWIYDTSVAMVHIALAGVFRRYPKLKLVSHHHGDMVSCFVELYKVLSCLKAFHSSCQCPPIAGWVDVMLYEYDAVYIIIRK
jgi:uncharacterized protein